MGSPAIYAKALCYQKKYAEARTIFTDVIANGTNAAVLNWHWLLLFTIFSMLIGKMMSLLVQKLCLLMKLL